MRIDFLDPMHEGPGFGFGRKILQEFDAAGPAVAIYRPELRIIRLTDFNSVGIGNGATRMHLERVIITDG